jgi:hypothetical protein
MTTSCHRKWFRSSPGRDNSGTCVHYYIEADALKASRLGDTNTSKLLEGTREPSHVDHLQPIIGANSTHDSVDVVLYCLFGEI